MSRRLWARHASCPSRCWTVTAYRYRGTVWILAAPYRHNGATVPGRAWRQCEIPTAPVTLGCRHGWISSSTITVGLDV